MLQSTYRPRQICTITSLDHLVLTVSSLDKTLAFYRSLGMTHETFGTAPQRHALRFGPSKINIHVKGKEFEPKAENVQTGSADLCFLVSEPVDQVLTSLKEKGLEVLEGGEVVARTGARGKLRSVYLRDPDGNLIE